MPFLPTNQPTESKHWGTSGQTNLTKVSHRHCTRRVQSYSPGGANVHPHLLPVHILNDISISSAFLLSSQQGVPILYNGPPLFPSNLPFCVGRSRPPSNTWFLGPTRVHNPNNISISSAVFARLKITTNWQTGWPSDKWCYSVRNNWPHLDVVLQCGVIIITIRLMTCILSSKSWIKGTVSS